MKLVTGITDGEYTRVEDVATVMDALAVAKSAMVEHGVSPERLMEILAGETRRRKGRRVPSLPEFTFPDSGCVVKVRRLGPWTLDQIRIGLSKARKEPLVPVRRVPDRYNDAGEPVEWRLEANEADPDYQTAKQEYENWLAQSLGYRLLDIIIASCVVVDVEDIDVEEIKAQRRALIAAGPQDEGTEESARITALHRKKIESMDDIEIYIRCIRTGSWRSTELCHITCHAIAARD